eukprot:GHVR01052588.1.p1 GENE.GHVR01052588.1~~GHVR01052588.1.p1  ORF type:complete len:174 (+),score=2.32 GHVR01052588.1:643-1164(+)
MLLCRKVPGFSRCSTHLCVVSQLIRKARENNKDLALIRLNLSYSYIINYMQMCTVDTTEVSSSSRESLLHVKYYFDVFRISLSIGNEITNLQRLEIDITSGYTMSVIVLTTAMAMLATSAETTTRGPQMATGLRQPPTHAFMDDLTSNSRGLEGTFKAWCYQHGVPQGDCDRY